MKINIAQFKQDLNDNIAFQKLFLYLMFKIRIVDVNLNSYIQNSDLETQAQT